MEMKSPLSYNDKTTLTRQDIFLSFFLYSFSLPSVDEGRKKKIFKEKKDRGFSSSFSACVRSPFFSLLV
jgi:hypothetical protein